MRHFNRHGIASLIFALLIAPASFGAEAPHPQSVYVLNNYGLKLGDDCDYVNAVDGGFYTASVVTNNIGAASAPSKHVGDVKVDDVHARLRYDQFSQVLADQLNGNTSSLTGAIYYLTNGGQVQQERDLTGMRLTELTIPQMDASNRAANLMELQVGFGVERATMATVLDGALPPVSAKNAQKAKQDWNASFRLTIPGLPTSHVRSIESISIKRTLSESQLGVFREPTQQQASNWTYPNIVFYVQPDDSQAYVAWFEDFIVNGNHLQANEKTFTLELLSRDLKTTLFTLQGTGVGIISAKYEQPVANNAPPTPGFRVEMYVEKMTIDVPGPTAAVTPLNTPSTIERPKFDTTRPIIKLPAK